MYYDKRIEVEAEPVVAKPSKPMPEPWQQTLLEAAQYLRTFGWCQGRAMMPDGRACLAGAVDAVQAGAWGNLIPRVVPFTYQSPVAWNDTRGRTKEEVIAALEAAAQY